MASWRQIFERDLFVSGLRYIPSERVTNMTFSHEFVLPTSKEQMAVFVASFYTSIVIGKAYVERHKKGTQLSERKGVFFLEKCRLSQLRAQFPSLVGVCCSYCSSQ